MEARRRHLIAALLALAALATRWPLRSQVLDEYDGANYALALTRFSLEQARPHPPGYIFFVWAARPLAQLSGDPVWALTAVAAVSGAVSMALLFELLAPALGLALAAMATAAAMFSTQVWLQHVRPMQDAFAFAWMLAGALALLWADRLATLRAWSLALGFVALSAGAKQVLPVFLVGLLLWAAWRAWSRFGWRALAAGGAAVLAGSLAWGIPLSLAAGSPRAYVRLAGLQAQWQKENDAAAFRPDADRLRGQVEATFVDAFGSQRAALPVWVLAAVGAGLLLRRPGAWLVWLVLPLVALRLLLLGIWPRFSIYYVPFVIALAVYALGAGLGRVLRTPWREVAVGAAAAAWAAGQARYVLPTLLALHQGSSPVDNALAAAQAAFPRDDMVVVAPEGLLGRFVRFHAERRGLRHAIEPDLPGRARHVVGVANARAPVVSSWASGAQLVGRWHLDVPRVDDVTPYRDVWQVAAYELRGPQVMLRRWREDSQGRTFATAISRIVVFRPPSGFVLRLRGRARGPVGFVVAGRRASEWDGRGQVHDLVVQPGEGSGDRIGIDVVPRCPAEEGCFELLGVEVDAR